jgi:hypothetical protein
MMRIAHLHSVGGNSPNSLFKVNLDPMHLADLARPLKYVWGQAQSQQVAGWPW